LITICKTGQFDSIFFSVQFNSIQRSAIPFSYKSNLS
jgi:hypothetical protein